MFVCEKEFVLSVCIVHEVIICPERYRSVDFVAISHRPENRVEIRAHA